METINYADWIIASGTVALVLATAVLAWFTWLLYSATRSPSVVATIEPNNWAIIHFDLHIQNEGTAAAFDVTVTLDPPLKRDRQEKPPLSTISLLRAGQKLSSHIGTYARLKEQAVYTIAIAWARKPGGRRESVTYSVNLTYFEGMSRLGDDPLYQIAEQVKKLREDWQWVARGNNHISVDSFSSEDREREAEQQRQWENEASGKSAETDTSGQGSVV